MSIIIIIIITIIIIIIIIIFIILLLLLLLLLLLFYRPKAHLFCCSRLRESRVRWIEKVRTWTFTFASPVTIWEPGTGYAANDVIHVYAVTSASFYLVRITVHPTCKNLICCRTSLPWAGKTRKIAFYSFCSNTAK